MTKVGKEQYPDLNKEHKTIVWSDCDNGRANRYQGVKTALHPFEDATGFRSAGLEQTSETLELNHSGKQDTGMPSPPGRVARELIPSGRVAR